MLTLVMGDNGTMQEGRIYRAAPDCPGKSTSDTDAETISETVVDITNSFSGILRTQKSTDIEKEDKNEVSTGSRSTQHTKFKKKVSFLSEKDLVSVVEISPREETRVTPEMEPCDLAKLIVQQQFYGFREDPHLYKMRQRNEAVSFPAFTTALNHKGTNANKPNIFSARKIYPNKCKPGGHIQVHNTSAFTQLSAGDTTKLALRELLTNNSNCAVYNDKGCDQKMYGSQQNKAKPTPTREKGLTPQRKNAGVNGNLLTSQSKNLNKHLKIHGETMPPISRVHSSPYRQSSATIGRPLGSLRVESAKGSLSISGARMDTVRQPERRIQSAVARVSPRKVYAWQVAERATKGKGEQNGPCISEMWNISPRSNVPFMPEPTYS